MCLCNTQSYPSKGTKPSPCLTYQACCGEGGGVGGGRGGGGDERFLNTWVGSKRAGLAAQLF